MERKAAQAAGRNSAVELLRILAVLMIVLSHICVHSGFDYTYTPMTVNRLFVQFGQLGNLGVVVFVLISGYFQYGRPFRSRAVTKLLSQVWFYSVAIFLVCRFGYGYAYPEGHLWAVLFPTIYNEYWFVTVFVILMLAAPFLNQLIDTMSRPQFKSLLAILGTVWVVIPTLTRQYLYAAEVAQFVLIYLLGAYARKYPDNLLEKAWLRWALAIGGFLVLYGLTIFLGYRERVDPEAFGAATRFYNRNSLIVLCCGLGLFGLGIYWKPFTCKFLNAVASCAFGVYLIHDNPAVRVILWQQKFCYVGYFEDGSLIPRMIVTVLGVYVGCTAIEWLRQKTVDRPMSALFHRVLSPLLDRLTWNQEESV